MRRALGLSDELIHDLELARHFEKLVISARVGFQKPNPGIFQHALARGQLESALGSIGTPCTGSVV